MNKNLILLLSIFLISPYLNAQQPNWDSLIKEAAKTEIYKPFPPIVTPGSSPQDAPSDAIILFNGKNLDAWYGDDITKAPGWDIANGIVTVNKKTGGIMTKQKFMDYQLHLEWRVPTNITGSGQDRGNSSVILAYLGMKDGLFEQGYDLQILDSYKNDTYVNGQNGALYKQFIPLANACKKPGEWQTYDIIWKAPRFNNDSTLKSPAFLTVIQNGVLIQDHVEAKGQTFWVGSPIYKLHGASPIRLQAHPDPSEPISFRNIWIRPL
jgi:3-keto-disaccharide hydrolase